MTDELIAKQIPTHRCLVCEASWIRHDDGTWSLMSKHCSQCCDNAPMRGQMVPIADMKAWKPVVEEFRRAASARGMSDMRAYLTVRALVSKAPTEAADRLQSQSDRIAVLEGENAELGKQRLMILAAVYGEAPRFVATICDENLDRSGALLGQVRELARVSLIKEGRD